MEFASRDPRYDDARSLYTETGALLTLEARRVDHDEIEGQRQRARESLPVLEELRRYALGEQREHVLLLGRPGSGKSTTLKRLLLELVEVALNDNRQPVPVLVQLKSDRTVPNLIRSELRRANLNVQVEQIEDWIFENRLILLFDGINEMPSGERRRQLREFREENPKIAAIFTTRDLVLGGDFGIRVRLEMCPLTELQTRNFTQKYLVKKGVFDANILLDQLNDRLREIAETPLLLKMLCDIFDPVTKKIPERRGDLFRLVNERFDTLKRDENIPVSDDFGRFRMEILMYLAFEMTGSDINQPTVSWLTIKRNRAEHILESVLTGRVEAPGQRAKEWLKNLLEHHLLQIAEDPQEIEFHHQLFQEYYAAEKLLIMLQDTHLDLVEDKPLKHFYLNHLRWTEPISLMLSLLNDEAEAVRVVRLALQIDLMLGARLSGEVKPGFQERTVRLIGDLDEPDWLKVELLGRTLSPAARPLLIQALYNQDINVVRTAATFLGEINDQDAVNSLYERLNVINSRFLNQKIYGGADFTGEIWTVHVEALSYVAPSKTFEFLRDYFGDATSNSWGILSELTGAPEILMYIAPKDFVSELIEDLKGLKAELKKVNILNLSQAPKILIKELVVNVQSLKSKISFQQLKILGLLGYYGKDDFVESSLIDFWDGSEDQYVQQEIVSILSRSRDRIADEKLLDFFNHPVSRVRKKIIKSLIKRKTQSVDRLKNLAAHKNWDIAWRASYVLGSLGYNQVLPLMLDAIENHKQDNIRFHAARILGIVLDKAAIPKLIKSLEDPDHLVRSEAACSLSKFDEPRAIDQLCVSINSGFWDVRRNSIRGLARLDYEEPLWQILEVENDTVWQSAAIELARLCKVQVLPNLCQALVNLGHESSNDVINVLGDLADDKTIDWLLNALKDPQDYPSDQYLCNRISLVLVRCKPDFITKRLPELIELLRERYIQQLFWVIPAIQQKAGFYNYNFANIDLPSIPIPWNKNRQNIIIVETLDNLIAGDFINSPSYGQPIQSTYSEKITMTNNPKNQNNFQIENVGAINTCDAQNIYGDQIGQQYNIGSSNYIQPMVDEFRLVLDNLSQKYPMVTDDDQALRIVDAEFTEIKSNPAHKLVNLRKQMLKPKRHLQALKAASIEAAKHFSDNNVLAKALIAYLDNISTD
ncbi:MAG: hypothetical protein HC838_03385 [Spirulinaceae cyanobacterium RM2_2_10]|nr:hypothetical protein [Spirulinaceae cyanobacterium RM2_2_10]